MARAMHVHGPRASSCSPAPRWSPRNPQRFVATHPHDPRHWHHRWAGRCLRGVHVDACCVPCVRVVTGRRAPRVSAHRRHRRSRRGGSPGGRGSPGVVPWCLQPTRSRPPSPRSGRGSGGRRSARAAPRTSAPRHRSYCTRMLHEADVKEIVEDITSVLFIIAAGCLGLLFITVAVR
jgi:hypothetical protein